MPRLERMLSKQLSGLVSQLSEEAIVVLAVLAAFAYALYLEGTRITTFMILFVALVGYVSIRVLKAMRGS